MISGLRCPACGGELSCSENRITCVSSSCGRAFPVHDGIPILLLEGKSVRSIADVLRAGRPDATRSRLRRSAAALLPASTTNAVARRNYTLLRDLLLTDRREARVLVVGGRTLGAGMEILRDDRRLQLVESDLCLGGRTSLVCDAHDLPFEAGEFDAVIAQAVLEHVLDPWRCVAEMRRVLKPEGLAYVEVPFMAQVHEGAFDFTRFTHSGLLALMKGFQELDSGIAGGPGTALQWSLEYFFLSFCGPGFVRDVVHGFGRLAFFWLRYLDPVVARERAAYDAAFGFYYLGRKSSRSWDPRDVAHRYRGSQK